MTLILSCVTQDYAVQVADRRLVRLRGRTCELADDDKNKMVLFCGQACFAYTGLAELDRMRTDLWIVDVLARKKCQTLNQAIETLRDGATEVFKPIAATHHTFVGAGWARLKEGLYPILVRVSNSYRSDGEILTDPQPTFNCWYQVLPKGQPFFWMQTGRALPSDVQARLEFSIEHHAKKRHVPWTVVLALVKAIRKCAETDPAVGANLLSISMPRVGVGGRSFMALAGGSPSSTHFNFHYWPAGAWNGKIYGPNFACRGTGATGFAVTPLAPRPARDT